MAGSTDPLDQKNPPGPGLELLLSPTGQAYFVRDADETSAAAREGVDDAGLPGQSRYLDIKAVLDEGGPLELAERILPAGYKVVREDIPEGSEEVRTSDEIFVTAMSDPSHPSYVPKRVRHLGLERHQIIEVHLWVSPYLCNMWVHLLVFGLRSTDEITSNAVIAKPDGFEMPISIVA